MTDAAILPGAPPHAWAAEVRGDGASAEVLSLRAAAAARAEALGVPTPKLEAWKYTSLAALGRTAWTPAASLPARAPQNRAALDALPGGWRIVLAGGRVVPELSRLDAMPAGVRVAALHDALAAGAPRRDAALAHLGQLASSHDDYVAALNTALLHDGVWIDTDAKAQIADTLHIVHLALTGDAAPMTHGRVLITAAAGSRLAVCEHFVSEGDGAAFTTGVTEIVCAANAAVDHTRITRENAATVHLGLVAARQERDSRLTSHAVSLGGALTRIEIISRLAGSGAEATLNGLYLGAGTQHVDYHTTLDHVAPQCSSAQTYRGVLGGTAHGVFNGAVIVRPDAQKTDARQSNKNLLLSSTAAIDTKPQLEIFANDVKCTHGATVGSLDEEALFYLRSRGIPRRQAETLLTQAFAQDIVHRIGDAVLRDWLDAEVGSALQALSVAGEGA